MNKQGIRTHLTTDNACIMANENTKTTQNTPQQIRTEILNILQDNAFHSGEDLAQQFNLSRSAISNHMRALGELGLDIYSVKRRGYKLASPIELLSLDKISQYLPEAQKQKARLIQVESIVSSTNDNLKALSSYQGLDHTNKRIPPPSGYCCLAEAQTSGRGRRGKTWVSPFGSSLYFSMLWHFSNGYQAMAGLSLMIGVIVNRTLQELNIQGCQLKWPNDIYYNGQKLAGILIEVEGQAGGEASAIIGIGINIQLPPHIEGIDQAFTDLHSITLQQMPNANIKLEGISVGRNKLAATLTKNLWLALPEFESKGLQAFLAEWQQADLYYQKEVRLISGDKVIQGRSQGIDKSGALLLQTKKGLQAFHGGEISVRPL